MNYTGVDDELHQVRDEIRDAITADDANKVDFYHITYELIENHHIIKKIS